jgi:biopolymer transport protein ExbD
MRVRRSSSTDSAIPTSSMADIAFLLIIFFMVTAVFSATKGLEMRLPPDDEEDADRTTVPAVLIQVLEDHVLLDCNVARIEDILPYLEPKLTGNPNKPVILYTHPRVEYRRMVRVYDLLSNTESRQFDVKQIHILTEGDIADYVEIFGIDPLTSHCG